MIAMIRKFLNLAGERKKQLYLAWLFQALTSVCEGAIYFTLFLVLRDIFWPILSCISFSITLRLQNSARYLMP